MPSPRSSITPATASWPPPCVSRSSSSPASARSDRAVIEAPLTSEQARQAALQASWTFPSILGSAFVVAWGAEAAQFYVSQGLALALLAWIQVLPEFAVEAVIAWNRNIPLMTANFTGALRLLTGLGWPTIWVVFALARRRRGEP